MTGYWFPDNTVFCNFAAVARLDLLRTVLSGRGRWVEAVADEARRSSRIYAELASIHRDGWMGEPIEIDQPSDVDRIELVRRVVFGGREDQPRRHLGEAQTCYVLETRPEFAGALWITDDRDAYEFGRRRRLATRRTADLVREAVHGGQLDRRAGFDLLRDMCRAGRHLWTPADPTQL